MVNNHKLALLYILKELEEKTDEDHALNATQLISMLEANGLQADRRTVYSNVELLQDFGVDIINKTGGNGGYYIGSRDFQLEELKLLIDAVQSSKFVTEKKSTELIGKLMKLTNEQKASELNRSVFIRNRMKTGNETIYYSVDTIHNCINNDKQISFQYGAWTTDKKLRPKREGERYQVSPWALTFDDENYYLIAYDEKDDRIKHFRVDKMMRPDMMKKARLGKERFQDFDLAQYAKKTFGMYHGEEAVVTFRCADALAGVMLDRFGYDIMMIPDGEGFFRVQLPIVVSRQFFGWAAAIGEEMEILSPPDVRQQYMEYLQQLIKKYK